ncbi:MAG: hypothetical protein R2792_20000 [Saprospiraceae bacterium]
METYTYDKIENSCWGESGRNGRVILVESKNEVGVNGEVLKRESRNAARGGMSEVHLVTRATQKAEAAIGGTGRFAGIAKHTYAKNLLSRQQSIYGNNLSLGSNYFNNNALYGAGNRGF